MAGSATNWFKAGPGAKGRVFISNATIMEAIGEFMPMAEAKRYIAESAMADPENLHFLAAMSPQPPGQAKSGPAAKKAKGTLPAPEDWAKDELSASIMAAQRDKDVRWKGDHDKIMRKAFREANPDLQPRYLDEPDPDNVGYAELWDYQGSAYDDVNPLMWDHFERTGSGALRPKIPINNYMERFIDNLMGLAHKLRSPADVEMTRAVPSYHALATWARGVKPGDSYVNKGFDSSSLDPYVDVYGNDVQLVMRVPKGSRGIYAPAVNDRATGEMEWLIPPNSSWVVTGKETLESGQARVYVSMVDQRDLQGNVVWP